MVGPHVVEPAERDAAHAWAASFRERRRSLRADLADGSRSLAAVVEGADASDDGAIKLLFVLESLPGAGKVATRRRLAQLDLAESTPLRELTSDQRATVLREFPLPVAPAGAPSGTEVAS